MEEGMMKKRSHIPAFGQWDYCDDLPISQYFEFAWQAGIIHGHSLAEDEDLFKAPAPAKPAQHHKMVQKRGGELKQGREEQRKQGRVYDESTQKTQRGVRAPMAVDEDLYKIPPELLYQKPKRKKLLRKLLSGCLGFNCIP